MDKSDVLLGYAILVLLLILCLFFSLILFAGDITTTNHIYFSRSVSVDYSQDSHTNSEDSIILTFYNEGEYEVDFSYTPNKSKRGGELPEAITDLEISKSDLPYKFEIDQELPFYLRVKISYFDNIREEWVFEYHDFE